jgi:hypothetical protein
MSIPRWVDRRPGPGHVRSRAVLAPTALAVAVLAASVAGCGTGEPVHAPGTAEPPVTTSIPNPAPPNSAEPNLAVGPDGIYLSWLERRGQDRHALRFARWDGAGWSEPGQVMERAGLFVNWADFPSLAILDDGTMAAHWLEKSGPSPYEYDVRMALSRDGGRSWSDDVVPHHQSGVLAEHGFVSLFPADGGVGVVWLDGRETVHGHPMTLRFTSVSPHGETGDEVLLDAHVCDCCQTSVATAASGLVVVYRGRSDDEVRDILVTRRVDGEWTTPRTVHDDGWVIRACPVNGPAVAAQGDLVVVAWFTAAADDHGRMLAAGDGGGRVLAAVSADGGATFRSPVRVDDGRGMGRVGVVMLDDGEALVTWLEGGDDGAEIRTRRVGTNGTGPSAGLATTTAARASGFPIVARRGDQILFAWTQPGDEPAIRTAVGTLHGPGPRAPAGD